MELVFATNNKHKLEEIRKIVPPGIVIKSLQQIGCEDELPETGYSLEANSQQKSRYIFDKYGMPCFSDDTGLEVEALQGRPGAFSARYAGPQNDSEKNISKVLAELNHEQNRKARFRTVISLHLDENPVFFEGIINGTIADSRSGFSGFGYDPVFIPEGSSKTFAEMLPEEKNSISHRAIAIRKLADYLNTLS